MSDSVATGPSYAEDFHSSTGGSSHRSASSRQALSRSRSATPTEQIDYGDDFEEPDDNKTAASYWYSDQQSRRLICIYAPSLHFWDEESSESGSGNYAEESQQFGDQEILPQLSVRSRRSAVNDRGTASYSSSFEATTTGTGGTASNSRSAQRTRSDSRRSTKSDSTSSSDSRNGTMSRLRIISIEELTQANAEMQAEHRFLDDARERLARSARSESSRSLQPPSPTPPRTRPKVSFDAPSIEKTAHVLLGHLRSRPSAHKEAAYADDRPHPNAYFPIMPSTSGVEVPRLAVEQLKIDSLRRGSRLLASAAGHDPAKCGKCREARERLDRADRLRDLAIRVRRGTTELRLQQHQPASVMSREMLNVARNARLVSEWMRTGKAPPLRGLT